MKENDNFAEKLEVFIKNLSNTKIDGCFNPWLEDDDKNGAAKKRLNNLKKFLVKRKDAEYILIGEAPSSGARYTGIPMTSEYVIKQEFSDNNEYEFTSENCDKAPSKERTASIVWSAIKSLNTCPEKIVIWNAFAFLDKNGHYIKNPDISYIGNKENIKIFKDFRNLFPNAELITIGKKAQIAFALCYARHIQHPSYRKSSEFKKELKSIVAQSTERRHNV